ncbi:hypothetical protein [Variovorax sp. DT-64]|uniref:hypothetical protein n=1 Tax=Variovorax sp. DT-64 TaxID=3396160 RepID=UPI003F1AAE78
MNPGERARRSTAAQSGVESDVPVPQELVDELGGELARVRMLVGVTVRQIEELQSHKCFESGVVEGARDSVKQLLDGRSVEPREVDALIEGFERRAQPQELSV